MSNTLAIADVTSALVNLLASNLASYDSTLGGINVTALPLDKALDKFTGTGGADQLNVFLYHVVASPFWRNQSMPLQVRRGETAPPPLGLTLHYLVSAWGTSDDVLAHRILGAAMAYLHDYPVFARSDLQTWLPASDLYQQVERVRITEEPLTVDEMYKLWSAFQTSYRVSAAYEVSVVLIESKLPATAPLPALTLMLPGPTAPHSVVTGAQPTLALMPLGPTITSLTPPVPRPFFFYGDTLTVNGYHLCDGAVTDTVTAQLSHPALTTDAQLSTSPAPSPTTSPTASLSVPLTTQTGAPSLPAGNYTLAIQVAQPNGPTLVTNELPFTLVPQITLPSSPFSVSSGPFTVSVNPAVMYDQRVFLIIGDQLFSPNAPITPPTSVTSLSFVVTTVPPGTYHVRLRVDGADSPVIDTATTTPTFLTTAQIVITA